MPDTTEILSSLTMREKAALCSGADFWHTVAVPRLEVDSIMVADGPHGLRVQLNAADHSGSHTSLPATCFPTAAALASSWNPGLIRRVGTALAEEALAQGIAVILGPGVNIKRSLLCGRNFEYFSEDPFLAGTAATAFVTGVQSRGVGNQTTLLRRLRTTGRPIIVVLSNGGVVDVASWDDDADAILECWLGGQAGASAAAQVLLGGTEPTGRLAETIPRRLADSPAFLNFPGEDGKVHYGEGIFVGYRYYDARSIEVAYPFGFGLSYTAFGYDELEVDLSGSVQAGDLEVRVGCRVTNTGTRRGREVVQLYVGQLAPAVARPPRELRAFAKIDLEPGAHEVVRFRLGDRDFAHWSTARSGWFVPTGRYQLDLGSSSRDIHGSTTIELDGTGSARPPLNDAATLAEWLEDPRGRAALVRAVGSSSDGRPNGIIADANRIRVISNFPLRALALFAGSGLNHDVIDAVCADLSGDP